MDNNDWLKSLKVGDKIIVDSTGLYGSGESVHTVEKITPSWQIKVSGYDSKFKNGQMLGNWRFKLVKWTNEKEEAIKYGCANRAMASQLLKYDFTKLNNDKLSRIIHIINEK